MKPLAVIAHYNKDLTWANELLRLGFDILVYDKGDKYPESGIQLSSLESPVAGFFVKKLPNVGREAHTYAHYIVENFDTMPDDQITVFLQDDAPRHCPMFWENLSRLNPDSDFHSISPMGRYTFGDSLPKVCRNMKGYWAKNQEPSLKLADYYDMIFATGLTLDLDAPHVFSHGANFAVKQTVIKKAGIDIFKRIVKYTEHAQHPIEAAVMERFWAQVLGCA